MSLDDWILALHLLSAFALVAAMTLFWVVFVALRGSGSGDATVAGLMRVGAIVVGIGSLGTIVFGIWLAISLNAYQVWDGWVIAAIVLWVIATAVGKQAGDGYRATSEMAAQLVSSSSPRSPELAAAMGATRAFWFHCLSTALIILIVIDMIWKPGA